MRSATCRAKTTPRASARCCTETSALSRSITPSGMRAIPSRPQSAMDLRARCTSGSARRFAQLETRLDKKLTEHDRAIGAILSAIRELMQPKVPAPKRRPIGFTADLEKKS